MEKVFDKKLAIIFFVMFLGISLAIGLEIIQHNKIIELTKYSKYLEEQYENISTEYSKLKILSKIKDLHIKNLENYSSELLKSKEEIANEFNILNREMFLMSTKLKDCENERPSFLRIMENVSKSYDYDVYSFNCVNFVNEYNRRLEEIGYNVRRRIVVLDCPDYWNETIKARFCYWDNGELKSRHAISEVTCYVDPTFGIFIEPEYYDKYGIG